ncbi:MAG: CAP domain-containing protein [Sphingobacteriales bacterium]|jgi:uncharacterized protein YkwD|nr:MAG: CAP domain-containing protein [Sphingobacteriales bacterium]
MSERILSIIFILVPFISFSQLTENDTKVLRQELSNRINNLRISKGLKPLIFNGTLRIAAEFHSNYMVNNDTLTHDEKDAKYSSPSDRVMAFSGSDFELVGENILYSKTQNFPLKNKDIIVLAEEMFLDWKNSPGHYANMIYPQYMFGDLGFKTDLKKNIIYATQVFGTKGHIVGNQISTNSFGLTKSSIDCEDEFRNHLNLVIGMSNNLKIVDNEVILYYNDISHFKEIFSESNDGIAIDLISKDQFECEKTNQLDFSPVYDGILLKPFYLNEILSNNKAESDYRIITKVGSIPNNLQGNDYSPALVLIKNGKACKYIYPTNISSKDYELRLIKPFIKDEPKIQLIKEGIVYSQIINYDFKTNITQSINLPKISKYDGKIHSIHVKSFSSVEGDSIHNEYLHNSRANFIQNHISSVLNIPIDLFSIDAKENWEQMNFQLHYFNNENLTKITHDSLKTILTNRNNSLPWDSLLFSQRKSIAIINYAGNFIENKSIETFAEFNLRTAVANKNAPLVNKALYEMYLSNDYNPEILFEPQIIEFIKNNPATITNYTALLSHNYYYDPYLVTDFIHSLIDSAEKLDKESRFNLLHLYTLVGKDLLEHWDISAERLSNIIHPLKINRYSMDAMKPELILNLHLTYIQYFGHINDGLNISKSFYYIVNYFKNKSLKKDDDVDLVLFFNLWSMYHLSLEHLLPLFEKNNLNEDGLFLLAEAMNYSNFDEKSLKYFEINKKAIQVNRVRWCEWINDDFQIKRNYQIKQLYCESCK